MSASLRCKPWHVLSAHATEHAQLAADPRLPVRTLPFTGGTYKDYMKDYIEVDVFDKTYTKPGEASTGALRFHCNVWD